MKIMSDCTLGKLGEQWHRERERVGDRCYQLVESLLGFKVPWSFLMLPLEGSLGTPWVALQEPCTWAAWGHTCLHRP